MLNGDFDITDDKVPSSVIRACLTICTDRKQPHFMLKTEVSKRWCDRFLELYKNPELIDKTGMCNTITHCSNEYMVSVKKYLVYGLRDQYIRLLKKLKVIDYKMVGLRVLEHFVEQHSSNFSFQL